MRKRCLSKILLTTLGVLLAMFLLPRGEVNVKGASANSGDGVTTYRALLIGEEAFDPICTRNRSDVLMMKELLQYVCGGSGDEYSKIVDVYDRGPYDIKADIESTFAGADDDDVSLFFIATHGDDESEGDYAGALVTTEIEPTSGARYSILLSDVAYLLGKVPGKVIVIIQSCGSGAAVYDPEDTENALNYDEIFTNNVIDAFSKVDTELAEEANTGEFRTSKFYVLTASRYQESSYGNEHGDSYNLFTKWLVNGMGKNNAYRSFPADNNGDKKVTLSELHAYIKAINDMTFITVVGQEGKHQQHAQIYPKNSDYVLFTENAIRIKSQPEDVHELVNKTVTFNVEAKGLNLSYQWQSSTDGGNTWADSYITGYNTKTLTVPVYKSRDGYMFRCVLTDEFYRTLTSKAATLHAYTSDELIYINETNFPDEIFRNYVSENFDTDQDGRLLPDEILNARSIHINSTGCRSLKGISYFTNLNTLECSCSDVTSIDLRKNKNIRDIICNQNLLESINLSGCENVSYLDVSENNLTSLDVTSCKDLVELNAHDNMISNIDLSQNSELVVADLDNNGLKSIKAKGLEKLIHLYCSSNALTNLNVEGCKFLTELYCDWNNLEYLNVKNCPQLAIISGGYNNLKSVDLSECTGLMDLDLFANCLEELDISHNPILQQVHLVGNYLTYLDISNNDILMQLYATTPIEEGYYRAEIYGNDCFLIFDSGVEIDSEYIELSISSQPSSVTTDVGATVKFEVAATGKGLIYKWQSSKDNGSTWADSTIAGYNTNSLSVSAVAERNGYKFRCVVSDKYGNTLNSQAATLTIRTSISIIEQPTDATVKVGENATFHVEATGDELKYQWQASKNGGSTWVNSTISGYQTSTLTVSAIADRNGYMFRCVVTDKNKISVISDPAKLTVEPSVELKITSHPTDVTTAAGSTATFEVAAEGDGLKYQWQTSKDGGSSWVNSGMTGYNTASLKVPANNSRNGYQFRCVVSDNAGNNVTSNAATLYVTADITIISQPADIKAAAGTIVSFSVVAEGADLKYQWQTSKDGGSTWVNSGMTGYKTNTLSVSAIGDRNGYQFRCVISDSNGGSVTSNAATLTIEASSDTQITSQPEDVTAAAGSTVTFSITATGDGLKYQWQTSKDGGVMWVNSFMTGYNTDTLTVSAIGDRNGYMFRCVVTDKTGGSIISDAALLHISASMDTQITAQPESVSVVEGSSVTFSITATGTGLKYQWQTSKDGGTTWVNSSMTGYCTNTLTVSDVSGRNGYRFRCVVTDSTGGSLYSDEAVLTVTKE